MLRTLRHGDSGTEVCVAEYLMGLAVRKRAEGRMTAEIVARVCSWQSQHGCSPDGVIGPKTWAALAENAPTCSTARNAASAATCALQLLLGQGLDADGLFGAATKRAVAAYQTAAGLGADSVCGKLTWRALIVGAEAGRISECVHYLQWDARWKNIKYSTHTSKQTIGNSGCGPSAMAQILATWVDPAITPVEMCEYAVRHGYRTYDSGTAWDFFEAIFAEYPQAFDKFVRTKSTETLKAALLDGALAVCSVGPGPGSKTFWTSGGHYVTLIGYKGGSFYAADPNKKACPRVQSEGDFKQCLKQAFIFWRR